MFILASQNISLKLAVGDDLKDNKFTGDEVVRATSLLFSTIRQIQIATTIT